MLRLAGHDIVFQEVPGEVTLALNLSCCPNRCPGCHSPQLREEIGETIGDGVLRGILERYGDSVTCVCFMGGDGDPREVERLARLIRTETAGRLKTGWYSGRSALPVGFGLSEFDYIKLGPYDRRLGGLGAPATNQRFYHVVGGEMLDRTELFRRRRSDRRDLC